MEVLIFTLICAIVFVFAAVAISKVKDNDVKWFLLIFLAVIFVLGFIVGVATIVCGVGTFLVIGL